MCVGDSPLQEPVSRRKEEEGELIQGLLHGHQGIHVVTKRFRVVGTLSGSSCCW